MKQTSRNCQQVADDVKSQLQSAPMVRLGDYIERSMVNNADLKYDTSLIEGVNSNHDFCESRANTIDINLKPYNKVVKPHYSGTLCHTESRKELQTRLRHTEERPQGHRKPALDVAECQSDGRKNHHRRR